MSCCVITRLMELAKLKIYQLRSFVTVVHAGNLSRTACSVLQPAGLSQFLGSALMAPSSTMCCHLEKPKQRVQV